MTYPSVFLAGTHSGVEKPAVVLGPVALVHSKGQLVQPVKVRPDFLDPWHHQLACEQESGNVDVPMLGAVLNRRIF